VSNFGLYSGLADSEGFGLAVSEGFALSEGLPDSDGFPDSPGVGDPDGSPLLVGVGVGLGGGGVTLPVGTPARITGSVKAFAQTPSPISRATPSTRPNTSRPLNQRGREDGAGEVTRSR
jgi:hypothetical protein